MRKIVRSSLIALALVFGFCIQAKGAAQEYPLHEAVKAADVAMVQQLLEGGADVNAQDNEGNTPLHYLFNAPKKREGSIWREACEWTSKKREIFGLLFELLVERTENFLVRNFCGRNFFQQWIYSFYPDGFEGLNSFFNCEKRDPKFEPEVWRRILNARDIIGRSAFHYLVLLCRTSYSSSGSCYICRMYDRNSYKHASERGARADIIDRINKTPIDYLISNRSVGNGEKYSILLDQNLESLNIIENGGNGILPPLHFAAQVGDIDLATWLLDEKGVDIGMLDEHGKPAFYYACKAEKIEMVEFLRRRGANSDCVTQEEPDPSDIPGSAYARVADLRGAHRELSNKHDLLEQKHDIEKDELERKFREQQEMFQAQLAQMGQALVMMQRDTEVLYIDKENAERVRNRQRAVQQLDAEQEDRVANPLDAEQQQQLRARALSAAAARLQQQLSVAPENQTALHEAVIAGDENEVTRLLGSDQFPSAREVNLADSFGRTALHYAASGDEPRLIRALLDAGALLEETDMCGWTALHHAIAAGSLDAANVLILKNADCSAVASVGVFMLGETPTLTRGWTPLHFAAGAQLHEAVETLCDRGANRQALDADGRVPGGLTDNDAIVALLTAGQ